MTETINIKEQLRLLAKLQELDSRIYLLRKEKAQIPIELESLQKSFEEKKAFQISLDEKAKATAAKRKAKELEVAAKEEEIKKYNGQLYSLKTNKEYQIMQNQIAGLKSDNSIIEEEILKTMDEQDILKEELEKAKAQLAIEEKKFQEEKKKKEEKINEIDFSTGDLTAKRGQDLPAIDKKILAQYERILKGKDGLALVRVANDSCQGCYMHLTAQVINEIKMFEKVIICGLCARMLYIEEDL